VTVRGTRFLVEANPAQVTEVDVLEGVVEVTGIHQPAKSLTLEPGFSARIPMDGDPEGPLPTNEIRPDLEPRGETTNDSESEKNGGFEDRNDASESPASRPNNDQNTDQPNVQQSGQNGPNR
jgi:hypothetical protein